MSYKVTEKDGRKVIQGNYVPKGYTCKCKSCTYTIEVLKEATDEEIKGLVKLIEGK